jgi:hypothetical protein
MHPSANLADDLAGHNAALETVFEQPSQIGL